MQATPMLPVCRRLPATSLLVDATWYKARLPGTTAQIKHALYRAFLVPQPRLQTADTIPTGICLR
jgi:hypothetical protein